MQHNDGGVSYAIQFKNIIFRTHQLNEGVYGSVHLNELLII
jgi:hypothetical protein